MLVTERLFIHLEDDGMGRMGDCPCKCVSRPSQTAKRDTTFAVLTCFH